MPILFRYIRKVLISLAAVSTIISGGFSQSFQFEDNRKRHTIGFRLVKNLIVVPITINGKGPFNFLLDTGIGVCLITNPSLIDSLHLSGLRQMKITGFGQGNELSASVASGVTLRLGKTVAHSMNVIILNEDLLELSETLGMPVHGLIGYDFFNSFMVEIRYSAQRITLRPFLSRYIPEKSTAVPISIEDKKPYIESTVELDGKIYKALKMIVDTGAGHAVSLESYDEKSFIAPDKSIEANLGVGLLGPIHGHIGRIQSISIGSHLFQNVVSSFPEFQEVLKRSGFPDRHGNLGNPILKRFRVMFDYSRRKVYLRPAPNYKEPFEHDMSGLELVTRAPDFKRILVNRVEINSAADSAGLQVSDEILSINFRPVREINMEEINSMFSSRAGRTFILYVINSKGDRRFVMLKLKRRI
ncbi:aspartyl protease family protein [Arcticibacter sp.]|uniref:aspartyl protease family protein n=1 Tax=Arcticibacter sp. TaxID=1872630 RepID=UPI00389057A6